MALRDYQNFELPEDVDMDRGFDVMDRSGKVYEHFASYVEACEYRAKKRGIVRYWLKEAAVEA